MCVETVGNSKLVFCYAEELAQTSRMWRAERQLDAINYWNSNEMIEKLSEIYFPCQITRKQIYFVESFKATFKCVFSKIYI